MTCERAMAIWFELLNLKAVDESITCVLFLSDTSRNTKKSLTILKKIGSKLWHFEWFCNYILKLIFKKEKIEGPDIDPWAIHKP